MITLVEVDSHKIEHIRLLFELLNNRKYLISHKKDISFDDHINFVKANPYRKWYIVYNETMPIGSCYCTYENSLGINLNIDNILFYKDTILQLTNLILPLEPKPSIRRKEFSINVPENNDILRMALNDLGAMPIQVTYLLP